MPKFTNDSGQTLVLPTLDPPVELAPGDSVDVPAPRKPRTEPTAAVSDDDATTAPSAPSTRSRK